MNLLFFVLAIFCIIVFVISLIMEILEQRQFTIRSLFYVVFICLNVYTASVFYKRMYNPDEPELISIENVKEIHKIDTTTVISGQDTTKTYTIYYSK